MVMRDLVGAAQLLRHAQHAAHLLFVHPEVGREIAHPRRAIAQIARQGRKDAGPQRLVLGRQAHLVARQAQKGSVGDDPASIRFARSSAR